MTLEKIQEAFLRLAQIRALPRAGVRRGGRVTLEEIQEAFLRLAQIRALIPGAAGRYLAKRDERGKRELLLLLDAEARARKKFEAAAKELVVAPKRRCPHYSATGVQCVRERHEDANHHFVVGG